MLYLEPNKLPSLFPSGLTSQEWLFTRNAEYNTSDELTLSVDTMEFRSFDEIERTTLLVKKEKYSDYSSKTCSHGVRRQRQKLT